MNDAVVGQQICLEVNLGAVHSHDWNYIEYESPDELHFLFIDLPFPTAILFDPPSRVGKSPGISPLRKYVPFTTWPKRHFRRSTGDDKSLSSSPLGKAAKASLVGANSVNGPPAIQFRITPSQGKVEAHPSLRCRLN